MVVQRVGSFYRLKCGTGSSWGLTSVGAACLDDRLIDTYFVGRPMAFGDDTFDEEGKTESDS